MADNNQQTNYAEIVDKVRTILALSGLAALLAGAGLTAVIWNMPQDNRFLTWLLMLGFLFALILVNMIYAYRTQPREFHLGIHVARREEGVEQGWEGATVTLFNNETQVQEASTNDMGYLTFPVKLDRRDNLYVVVVDSVTGKKIKQGSIVFRRSVSHDQENCSVTGEENGNCYYTIGRSRDGTCAAR